MSELSRPIAEHELRLAVITRLRGGWSYRRVRETLPVRPGLIAQIGKEIGAAYTKPRGRGRRLTPEFKAQIRAAVASGQRSAEIQKQFRIDYDTVMLFRRASGDVEDRRHWTKYPAEHFIEAEKLLRAGLSWRDVSAKTGCCLATLQRHVGYRKHRELTAEQLAQATERVRTGQSWDEGCCVARCLPAVAAEENCVPKTTSARKQAGMRKTNPLHRWHVTQEEKNKIRELTLAGMRQSAIARQMNLTPPSVSRAQKAMGLPTHLPIPEKKIMNLFEKGWGGYKIARHLRVPVSAVYRVAHNNKFHRADSVGYPTPPENETRFIQAVQRREGYINHLAKKYGVGVCKAQRLAHEVLVCPEFRPGASKPPLSSNFPQRHFDVTMAQPDDFVRIVARVCQMCFGGRLPATEDDTFVSVIMFTLTQTSLVDQPQATVDEFAVGLRGAVHALRESQSGVVH